MTQMIVEHISREDAEKLRRLLWRWGNTPYFVQRKEREIKQFQEAINDAYETLQAQRITDMPRGSGAAQSSVERAVEAAQHRRDQYEQCVETIGQEIDQSIALKLAIDEGFSTLEPDEQRVLQLRYIDSHRWEYIGLKMNFNDQHARRIERRALDKLARFCTIT